jgi:1-acyl-sn-glycerol-3-phosphate acyltransferase
MVDKQDGARVISLADGTRRKARRVTPSEVAERARATGRTTSGARTRARSARPPEKDLDASGVGLLSGIVSDPRVRKWLQFARRRLEGQYVVDEYGYDEELVEDVLLPLLRPMYHSYWRVEVRGIENVPSRGPALLAANHSGVVPWDATMLLVAIREEHPARPVVRLLGADLLWGMPVLSHLARKAGNTVACDVDAHRMLRQGEIVGVFPEGFKGIGKLFRDRYRLQRFGRGGFVEVALRTGAPIVPVGIVGAEEIYPMLSDLVPLARLLGLPYFPVTPAFPALGLLGLIPLPTKWIIEFGEPIPTDTYGADAASDAMTVFNIGDGVRDTIQQILYRNLVHRRTWFW